MVNPQLVWYITKDTTKKLMHVCICPNYSEEKATSSTALESVDTEQADYREHSNLKRLSASETKKKKIDGRA